MLPSVQDVIRIRLQVTGLLRVMSIVLLLYGLLLILTWVVQGLTEYGMFSGMFTSYYAAQAVGGAVVVLLSIALFAFAPPISRFVIPFRPNVRCPVCGYILAGIRTGRCPECALPIPAELTGDADLTAHEMFRRRAVALARLEPVVRWTGIVLVAFGGSLVLATVLDAAFTVDDRMAFLPIVLAAAVLATPGALLLVWSHKLGRDRRALREAVGEELADAPDAPG